MTASELAAKLHNPKLVDDSHVYQVWQDGEITIQKAGPLLWQRNLHQIARPKAATATMPVASGPNSYAFVTCADAWRVRALIGAPDAEDECIGKPAIARNEQ